MAVTAAADVAVAGNGTRSQQAYESVGRVEPTIFRFLPAIELPQGWASHTFPTWGADIDAAAASENAAALTPQTLGTLGSLALTPSGVRASMGGSSEAFNRVLPENDLKDRYEFELRNALARYYAYDTSVGVVSYHFGQVTANGGSGGATVGKVIAQAEAARASIGDASVHLILWGDDNLCQQLDDDIRSNGGSAYGNVAQSDFIHHILETNGFENGKAGYHATLGGSVHVFKDPNPSALPTSGSDSYACLFVPHLPGLNGIPLMSDKPQPITQNLAPAFGIAYRPDPAKAARLGVYNPSAMIEGEDEAGSYVLIPRAYAGVNQGVIDGWRMGAVGIISQTSARRYIFAT